MSAGNGTCQAERIFPASPSSARYGFSYVSRISWFRFFPQLRYTQMNKIMYDIFMCHRGTEHTETPLISGLCALCASVAKSSCNSASLNQFRCYVLLSSLFYGAKYNGCSPTRLVTATSPDNFGWNWLDSRRTPVQYVWRITCGPQKYEAETILGIERSETARWKRM